MFPPSTAAPTIEANRIFISADVFRKSWASQTCSPRQWARNCSSACVSGTTFKVPSASVRSKSSFRNLSSASSTSKSTSTPNRSFSQLSMRSSSNSSYACRFGEKKVSEQALLHLCSSERSVTTFMAPLLVDFEVQIFRDCGVVVISVG